MSYRGVALFGAISHLLRRAGEQPLYVKMTYILGQFSLFFMDDEKLCIFGKILSVTETMNIDERSFLISKESGNRVIGHDLGA